MSTKPTRIKRCFVVGPIDSAMLVQVISDCSERARGRRAPTVLLVRQDHDSCFPTERRGFQDSRLRMELISVAPSWQQTSHKSYLVRQRPQSDTIDACTGGEEASSTAA